MFAVSIAAILTGGPCASPWTRYRPVDPTTDGDQLTTPRMAWETSAFLAGTVAGSRTCPDLVEADGGDQYPMRVVTWRPACAPMQGNGATSRGKPTGVSESAGLYTDVEPAPWFTDPFNREILAARAYGELTRRPAPCGAGVQALKHGTCEGVDCVPPLVGDPVLTDVPVVDLEVADLYGTGARQIVIAGELGLAPSCLSIECNSPPPTLEWPTGPASGDCNRGGVAVLHPKPDPASRAPARVDLWLLDGVYKADTKVGKPTWVRVADVDLNGDLEILAAFGAAGVLRLEPTVPGAADPVAAVTRLSADALPSCPASGPAPRACWLYRDVRVSTDADLVRLAALGPDFGPAAVVLVETLTCAAPHTDPATCPPVMEVDGEGPVPPRVTARDANTGRLLRNWTLPGGAIPMSVQLVDGCGVATTGPCSAATERPLVLIGASTVERDPVYLLAQELAVRSATLHPLTSAPRAWYRDLDTLHPLLPSSGWTSDAACRGQATLPAGVTWVPAKATTTTLIGSGGQVVVGACASQAPVPACPAPGAKACFSAEPNERFVVWSGERPDDAAFAVFATGPQHLVLTDSFMGPGATILWSPATTNPK
jgi:hypothetical protein